MFLNLNINGKGVHKSLNKIYLHADNFCSACDLSIIEKQNAENCCFSGIWQFLRCRLLCNRTSDMFGCCIFSLASIFPLDFTRCAYTTFLESIRLELKNVHMERAGKAHVSFLLRWICLQECKNNVSLHVVSNEWVIYLVGFQLSDNRNRISVQNDLREFLKVRKVQSWIHCFVFVENAENHLSDKIQRHKLMPKPDLNLRRCHEQLFWCVTQQHQNALPLLSSALPSAWSLLHKIPNYCLKFEIRHNKHHSALPLFLSALQLFSSTLPLLRSTVEQYMTPVV